METARVQELAAQMGFEKAACISTEDLVFVPEYRKYCAENTCGNYGKNYACPPDCGTPEEMEAKIKKFEHAIVFQLSRQMEDIFDADEAKSFKKIHTSKTLQIVEELKSEGLEKDGIFAMCGPCGQCETCGKQSGTPCVNEEMRFSCLSAYCIDVSKLAEHCGMDIQWTGNKVSFFSMYAYGRK